VGEIDRFEDAEIGAALLIKALALLRRAETLLVETVDTYEKVFGTDNRFTMAALNDLAATYCEQGQWKKAE